jgi:hypothetical protein
VAFRPLRVPPQRSRSLAKSSYPRLLPRQCPQSRRGFSFVCGGVGAFPKLLRSSPTKIPSFACARPKLCSGNEAYSTWRCTRSGAKSLKLLSNPYHVRVIGHNNDTFYVYTVRINSEKLSNAFHRRPSEAPLRLLRPALPPACPFTTLLPRVVQSERQGSGRESCSSSVVAAGQAQT